MDRTVLPGNPGGEAADGVVGAEDRASTADSLGRVNRDRDNGRVAIKPRAADRTAITVGQDARIGRSSGASAPGR